MSSRNTPSTPMFDAASAVERPVAARLARGGILGPIGALVARWAEAERGPRDLERLRAMPDHMLRDIGLTRDDLRSRTVSALAR